MLERKTVIMRVMTTTTTMTGVTWQINGVSDL